MMDKETARIFAQFARLYEQCRPNRFHRGWLQAPCVNEEERFWSHVHMDPDDHWCWRATLHRQGYGVTRPQGRILLAHRVAFVYAYEQPGTPNVNHKRSCNFVQCVRPDHLYGGTQRENMADRAVLQKNASSPRRRSCK